ncbi:hypothetical protein C8J55DRAFT_518930 [Lentinula edodes]|uniref:RING-type domain-containing protein n=1 Tax=Lentinula lateritia TaxID=40482 RepID=A0A9W9A5S7_9AGAR|nr:hypothetical protein C8J55DRAFT_518930 [Lentinula edodes]
MAPFIMHRPLAIFDVNAQRSLRIYRIHAGSSPRHPTTHPRHYPESSPRRHTMLLRSMTHPQQSASVERISSTPPPESAIAIVSSFPSNSNLEPLPAIATGVDFGSSQKRLYDEQKNTIEFLNQQADLLSQDYSANKEIIHLTYIIRKLNHSCPFCKELAWNPHILTCGHTVCSRCMTNERRKGIKSGKSCRCPACGFPVFRKPIPSVTIQNVVERIATKLQIAQPPHHELVWLEPRHGL